MPSSLTILTMQFIVPLNLDAQARMVVERTEAWWKRRDLERDRVRGSVENLVEQQRFREEERHRGRERSRWGYGNVDCAGRERDRSGKQDGKRRA
ncbi:hypothetical protein ACLOJK_019723 [Asimina triloba]